MPADSITPIEDVRVAAAVAAYHAIQPVHPPEPTVSQASLADAQARAAETLEELALHGDRLAIAQLIRERHEAHAPSVAAAEHPPHEPGAHEPGKGQLIDEYD